MAYEIEDGHPIPEDHRHHTSGRRQDEIGKALRALAESHDGASVFVPMEDVPEARRTVKYFSARASNIGKGWYMIREGSGGFRIWKIGVLTPRVRKAEGQSA